MADGPHGPSINQNPGRLDIYRESTEVVALTDVDATETPKRDKIIRKSARVARTNTCTIKITELGKYDPVDDYPPGRPVESDDETIIGGESACESELEFPHNRRSTYANDNDATSEMITRNSRISESA